MLSEDRWLLPEGVEELLPAETRRLENLRRVVLGLFESWGYQQVIPPFIEYLESLLTGTGHDLDLQTFKLIDQISGRLLGVRADMTPQVARIDARHAIADRPSRLCYLGTVLHTQSDHLEKSRSPMQVGAELYGHAGIASDLEIIRLMLAMFDAASVGGLHLDLGHVGIYRTLIGQAGLNAQQEMKLFDILQRKARPELQAFLDAAGIAPQTRERLYALIDLHGGIEIIEEARARLAGAGDAIRQDLDDLDAIARQLREEYPQLPMHFDLAELRGYHYKTGMVFAAFVPGYGREVARGGRYDDIGKVFGAARPATGFSADLKILSRLSEEPVDDFEHRRVFAPDRADAGLQGKIDALRGDGWVVVRELTGQRASAIDMGCRYELRPRGDAWDLAELSAPGGAERITSL